MEFSVNILLVIATVGASLYAWNNPAVFQNWKLNPYLVKERKQYWRFITSGFIHADYMHLGFNMFTLFFIGQGVESAFAGRFGGYGGLAYALFYILGILVSDLPSYIKHKDHAWYNSIGASGGVSAVMFSFILFAPTQDLCLYGFICIPAIIFGVLYLLFSYQMAQKSKDNINHDAHFFGAVYGIIATVILIPQVVPHFIEQITTWRWFW
ncbi:MAG: rhomboid family intramembrane serine protease [Cytophagaceae bacterium]